MRLAIMQPYLFPYLGYFQLIKAVDKFVFLDDVNFIMRGWINRNRILVNGKEHLFSMPINKASQNKLISECEIVNDNKWRKRFLKTIEISYKKAPFYNETSKIISAIIFFGELNLSEFIFNHIRIFCDLLNIDTEIVKTSKTYNNSNLKAQDKLVDICKQEKADNYVNAIGGMDLYDKEIFRKNMIQLSFIKNDNIIYKQFNNNFIPNLSIIDVMMFNDINEIKNLLDKFELI